MNKGGTIALVHQPRKPGATESDADEAGHKIMAYLKDAGFERIILHKKNMKPVTSVCVMGIA
jgi:hypothetical protein